MKNGDEDESDYGDKGGQSSETENVSTHMRTSNKNTTLEVMDLCTILFYGTDPGKQSDGVTDGKGNSRLLFI